MFNMLKQAGTAILIAGVALALLKAFGGDPFAIAEWAVEWVWHAINRVAEFFMGSETFRDATKKPAE